MKKKPIIKNSEIKGRILVIDDEPEIGWIFSRILGDHGYDVASCQTGKEGLKRVREFMPDLVFLDMKLPDKNGITILKEIKKINHGVLVIMITAYETIQTAVSAMKLGAYDYISKPLPNERLKIIVDKALETRKLAQQVDHFNKCDMSLSMIKGQSRSVQDLFKKMEKVAPHDVSVILRGESGTGKELAARVIHSLSKRRGSAFIPIDCATLPDTLVESELFGYEKGAFTGADTLKIGKFETADNGTLFLDEIGNLAMHIQIKLLRVIQERKIQRLGGKNSIPINVRIITATNRDLEEAVKKGEFRDDLYHRLNVFEIKLPLLRDRGDDVIILAQHFLDKSNKATKKNIKGFSSDVLKIFREYSWPGNVRELENTVKTAVILAMDIIMLSDLPQHMAGNENTPGDIKMESLVLSKLEKDLDEIPLKTLRKNVTANAEKYMIEKILNKTNWNKKKTAEILEIDYKSLFTKIKKYEIRR